MEFIPAGERLGSFTQIRTLTLNGAPDLPDGEYAFVDCYCTDPECDCRKTMIQVHLNKRFVSLINYGWEPSEYYAKWYGTKSLDHHTLAEMKGPSIDINSPDLVPPHAILGFFKSILDDRYQNHFRTQYARFKQALTSTAAAGNREAAQFARHVPRDNRQRNQPCSCGSGRKFKACCGRGR
jgi:hypothetical protein